MDTGHLPFTRPSNPTTAGDDDLSVLRLIRSRRVGPATYHRLVAEHGSARAALDALPAIAAAAGISDYEACPEGVAAAELAAGRKVGARLVRCDSPLYPAALRDIDGAPPVLWVRGDPAWLSRNPVAVIGARNASSLGLRMARGMAAGLGEAGHTVVAGLARGIDTAAHTAALPTGTVAVMAGGVDVIYPAENVILAAQIAEKGVLVSEQPPGTEPQARHFPTRNRIVSGLSLAVVVIEAAHRSGTLITAKNALDQGREVMAVPGHPMDARASGCNQLIRDGALLVRNSADVCAALGREAEPAGMETAPAPAPHPEPAEPGQIEAKILSRLGPSPSDENDVIRDLGLPAAAASAAILSLELQGRLLRVPGGRLALG
ncbi:MULTISPECIES: DNA-processing protein DprA [Paracoccus]|uniref:DNA-processing protein DprA n=1 Tax=Paracoccus fontiphilus TaxID=1815556 RepID=A0ABV7IFC8_9RHOB|nr:DNA-processing protein DprA [Paracoccus fontiphilus]